MAGFAVVVRRSGEAVPPVIVEAMRQSLQHRAPDGVEVSTRDNVAVVFGRLHATPEARFERQPHPCSDGTWLIADARVDNRAELMDLLRWSRPKSTTSDVELLGACFERDRLRATLRVLGDFAMVAVSPDGELTCFRDHLGVKPLYFWENRDWVVIASELRQIAAHPDAPRTPNVGLLGEYLSGTVESATATVIRNVHRLPAAHAMTIGVDGVRTWRYWTPPLDERIELKDRSAYEERFIELFTEAVRCRMRTPGPIGTELSGGLDSTSVTATAVQLIKAGDVRAESALAISCMFPWSARADEQGHIAEAIDYLSLDWTEVVDDVDRRSWAFEDARFWSDIPIAPDGPDHRDLCRLARERGCSVVLTGQGGDGAYDCSGYALLDLIQGRRPLAAWRLAESWVGPSRRETLSLLLRTGVLPLKPPWIRRLPPRRRAPEVTGAARAEAQLDLRRKPGRLPRRFRSLRAQGHFETFWGGYHAMCLEMLDRVAALAGVEYRHPYLDRRVVEFGCQVPVLIHEAGPLNRSLQRGALRDVLPPGVAVRQTKADFGDLWMRELDTHLSRSELARSRVIGNGWVDPIAVDAALERTRIAIADRLAGGSIFQLWGIVQAESVLRALELPRATGVGA